MASAKTSKPAKKQKKKMGRPETDVVWIGIGVRFTEEEKERLRVTAPKFSLSQAEFIRRGTLKLMDEVARTGRLEIEAGS